MVLAISPGKLHLIGEHAVVYGEPAILSAIDLYVKAAVEESNIISFSGFNEWSCDLNELLSFTRELNQLWLDCFKKGDFKELNNAVKKNPSMAIVGKVYEQLKLDKMASIKINGDLPAGVGLGYSAALSLSIALALAKMHGIDLDKERLNQIAFECEKFMHGTPSGGDNSACCYGGFIWFEKKNGLLIRQLKIDFKPNFILVNTGKPQKTTSELVQKVRELDPDYRDPRVRDIGIASHKMLEALKNKDERKIAELMNFAHQKLSELGVSTKKLDEIAKRIVEIGGAAKLCGAGGGGTMLCWHSDLNYLANTINELGYKPLRVSLGVDGAALS